MMQSPEIYIDDLKDKSYEELIKERDRLVLYIQAFEKDITKDFLIDCAINPSPETAYQHYMLYLSKLLVFMHDKYNKEYIYGDKTLFEDEEE